MTIYSELSVLRHKKIINIHFTTFNLQCFVYSETNKAVLLRMQVIKLAQGSFKDSGWAQKVVVNPGLCVDQPQILHIRPDVWQMRAFGLCVY